MSKGGARRTEWYYNELEASQKNLEKAVLAARDEVLELADTQRRQQKQIGQIVVMLDRHDALLDRCVDKR